MAISRQLKLLFFFNFFPSKYVRRFLAQKDNKEKFPYFFLTAPQTVMTGCEEILRLYLVRVFRSQQCSFTTLIRKRCLSRGSNKTKRNWLDVWPKWLYCFYWRRRWGLLQRGYYTCFWSTTNASTLFFPSSQSSVNGKGVRNARISDFIKGECLLF